MGQRYENDDTKDHSRVGDTIQSSMTMWFHTQGLDRFQQSKFYSRFYNTAFKRQGKGSRWRTTCSSEACSYHFKLSYLIGGSTCWGSTKYRLAYIPCYSTLLQKLWRIYNNLVSPWLRLTEVGICLVDPLFCRKPGLWPSLVLAQKIILPRWWLRQAYPKVLTHPTF